MLSVWVVAYLLLAPPIMGWALGVVIDAALTMRELRRRGPGSVTGAQSGRAVAHAVAARRDPDAVPGALHGTTAFHL